MKDVQLAISVLTHVLYQAYSMLHA